MTDSTATIKTLPIMPVPGTPAQGFDPEMLFVECARCGSPIVWEAGKTTRILDGAGIDALELDPHCMLIASGCPRCSQSGVYHVQIVRMQAGQGRPSSGRVHGNA